MLIQQKDCLIMGYPPAARSTKLVCLVSGHQYKGPAAGCMLSAGNSLSRGEALGKYEDKVGLTHVFKHSIKVLASSQLLYSPLSKVGLVLSFMEQLYSWEICQTSFCTPKAVPQ